MLPVVSMTKARSSAPIVGRAVCGMTSSMVPALAVAVAEIPRGATVAVMVKVAFVATEAHSGK